MTMTSSRSAPPAAPPEAPAFLLRIDLAHGRISVLGDLDRGHAQQLIDAVDALHRSCVDQWSIDAAGITFCDAGGLRGLLYAQEVAVRAGHTLLVTRPSRMLARLLTLVAPEGQQLVGAELRT